MKTFTQEELKVILEKHTLWLSSGGIEGKKADLSGADLRGANLSNADLSGAYLSGANLKYANLTSKEYKDRDNKPLVNTAFTLDEHTKTKQDGKVDSLKSCECGGDKINSTHSRWCPKF
jgi:uncharacterized protein YjbI with pentapeptide repeats